MAIVRQGNMVVFGLNPIKTAARHEKDQRQTPVMRLHEYNTIPILPSRTDTISIGLIQNGATRRDVETPSFLASLTLVLTRD